MGILSYIKNFKFVRLSSGSWINTKNGFASYGEIDFDACMSNPVVAACVNIRANYLSKVKFAVREKDGTLNFDDESLAIINRPNIYQSREDFLKQYEIYRLINGWSYQKTFGGTGSYPVALYNLDPRNITFNEFKKPFLIWKGKDLKDSNREFFNYYDNGDTKTFFFKDVITFFDISTINKDNPYISPSRILSISKQVNNLGMVTDAENRAIKTIGHKVVFSTEEKTKEKGGFGSGSVPLGKNDTNNIKSKLNNISTDQKVLFAEKPVADLDLSVKLKDLGLNETSQEYTGVIVKAFGLTNEVYEYQQTGATFENQKEAELKFVQNVTKPVADDLASSYTTAFGDVDRPFVAVISHFPAMQISETMRADRAEKISKTMRNLMLGGMSKDEAMQVITDLGVNTNVQD